MRKSSKSAATDREIRIELQEKKFVNDEFRKVAASTLLVLIARAATLSVSTVIHLTDNKKDVLFVTFNKDANPCMDDTLALDSDKWEYDNITRRFDEEVAGRAIKATRAAEAGNLWKSISDHNKNLLKEYYLPTRYPGLE